MPIEQSRMLDLVLAAESLVDALTTCENFARDGAKGQLSPPDVLLMIQGTILAASRAQALVRVERVKYDLTNKRNARVKRYQARQRAEQRLMFTDEITRAWAPPGGQMQQLDPDEAGRIARAQADMREDEFEPDLDAIWSKPKAQPHRPAMTPTPPIDLAILPHSPILDPALQISIAKEAQRALADEARTQAAQAGAKAIKAQGTE
jgi:hypothetical protein